VCVLSGEVTSKKRNKAAASVFVAISQQRQSVAVNRRIVDLTHAHKSC
jgi:hypothetical protein